MPYSHLEKHCMEKGLGESIEWLVYVLQTRSLRMVGFKCNAFWMTILQSLCTQTWRIHYRHILSDTYMYSFFLKEISYTSIIHLDLIQSYKLSCQTVKVIDSLCFVHNLEYSTSCSNFNVVCVCLWQFSHGAKLCLERQL